MEQQAIVLKNIRKSFADYLVFEHVHLAVEAGTIVGISGPNGAGKSILLRILCGMVRPDEGEIVVLGQNIGKDVEFPSQTGALIDAPAFLENYSARRNLELLAGISGGADGKRIDEVLHIVGLDVDDRRPVRVYSNGMRKRLGFAQAILEEPRVLILDEPTDAIDQPGWKDVYEYLIQMKEQGTAVLFSSNNMDEIAILCDEAYVLADKKLRAA